ncbi:MAG: DUF6491 family protein [Gammaproteobacteria bacterium]
MNTLIKTHRVLAAAVLAVAPIGLACANTAPAPEASIPFVNFGGIHDWKADHDKGLWVQDIHRKWYYATFMGPCVGLDFAVHVGFDARPMDTFDRFSSVIVPGWGRCTLKSMTTSDGPPVKRKAAAPAANS